MSESDRDFYITQNTFSGVEFPTIELNEILGNAVEELDDKNESKKHAQDKDDEQNHYRGILQGILRIINLLFVLIINLLIVFLWIWSLFSVPLSPVEI